MSGEKLMCVWQALQTKTNSSPNVQLHEALQMILNELGRIPGVTFKSEQFRDVFMGKKV